MKKQSIGACLRVETDEEEEIEKQTNVLNRKK